MIVIGWKLHPRRHAREVQHFWTKERVNAVFASAACDKYRYDEDCQSEALVPGEKDGKKCRLCLKTKMVRTHDRRELQSAGHDVDTDLNKKAQEPNSERGSALTPFMEGIRRAKMFNVLPRWFNKLIPATMCGEIVGMAQKDEGGSYSAIMGALRKIEVPVYGDSPIQITGKPIDTIKTGGGTLVGNVEATKERAPRDHPVRNRIRVYPGLEVVRCNDRHWLWRGIVELPSG